MIKVFFVFLLMYNSAWAEFEEIKKNYQFSFPKDHGRHIQFPLEWWYLTGHLESDDNEYGYQLTFFKIADKVIDTKENIDWNLNEIYTAHFALTDVKNKKHYFEEKISRGEFNLAGASDVKLSLWLYDWKIDQKTNNLKILAKSDKYSINLNAKIPNKVIIHGQDGISIKNYDNSASYYMSYPYLETSGQISIGQEKIAVEGSSWFDHEVMDTNLSETLTGWDWFAIQISKDLQYMFYRVRNSNKVDYYYGSKIKKGIAKILNPNTFIIKEIGSYKDKDSQITYPNLWQITSEQHNFNFKIKPKVKNQSIKSLYTDKEYWEGNCEVFCPNKKCGNAYVELVGYQ